MISLEQLKIIEPDLKNISEEELIRIKNLLYAMGNLAIESYLEKNGSKNHLGVYGQIKSNMQK